MKKALITILLTALLTGCGQEAIVTNPTPAQETDSVEEPAVADESEAPEAEENTAVETETSPETAMVVDNAFRWASGYERTLTVNGTPKTIKGSYKDGEGYHDKGMRMLFTNGSKTVVQGTGATHMDYGAYPVDLDPVDLISSKDFTNLKVSGNTITGVSKGGVLPEGEVTMTLQDGMLKELTGPDFSLTTDFSTFPDEWLSDEDTFTVYNGSEEMLGTTGKSTFEFSDADQILQWGKDYAGLTDQGNGVTFHMAYDIYMNGNNKELEGHGINAPNYVDEDTLVLDDIYVSPLFRYGDMKGHTLSDVGEIMKSLRDFQLSQNPSAENKKRASDKWFTVGSDTNGLPRWYFELVYGDYETRTKRSEEFWSEVNQ